MTQTAMRGEEGSPAITPRHHPAVCSSAALWDLSAPGRDFSAKTRAGTAPDVMSA